MGLLGPVHCFSSHVSDFISGSHNSHPIASVRPQIPLGDFTTATMASAAKSFIQNLRRHIKKPWEITGPCADPEYKHAIPKATEYRILCPATLPKELPVIPTSDPETVFDIKYYSRDQRRNRPPIRRTVLKKADVEKMMKETSFDVKGFPQPYLTAIVEEDYDHIGGGYQK